MRGENSAKLVQRVNVDLCGSERHRRTGCGIAHPGRNLARYAGTYFEIQDLLAAPPCSLAKPQSLAMQRMPPILNDNKLRSVC
jgi:hypothetical protein